MYGLISKKSGSPGLMVTNAVVDVVLGVLLFLFPTQVAGLIVYLIGVALILLGALQLIVLIGSLSLVGGGFSTLILSICALVGGIVLVFNPFTLKVMSVLAGIALIFYGVQELISAWKVPKAVKIVEVRKLDTSGIGEAKEVEYEREDYADSDEEDE